MNPKRVYGSKSRGNFAPKDGGKERGSLHLRSSRERVTLVQTAAHLTTSDTQNPFVGGIDKLGPLCIVSFLNGFCSTI